MLYSVNVMIWVWLKSRIVAKLWVKICRSARWLALIKACIHVGLAHRSSIYIMKYDIWSCSWFKLLVQSSGFFSVFWWLCSRDSVLNIQIDWLWFSSLMMGYQWFIDLVVVDSEIDDWVSVIDWYRWIWWLYWNCDWFWASMLLMGPILKIYET